MAQLSFYKNVEFVSVCYNEKLKQDLIQQGFKPTKWSNNTYYKESQVPSYSKQLEHGEIKYLCEEPENYSCREHQYHTTYYQVKQSDFEKLTIKPTLEKVHIPLRLHNYDGIIDIIQQKRDGIGWEERYQKDYYNTYTYIFFVVD